MESAKPTKSRHDYAIAWIAALSIERASAIAMLDEEHGRPHNFRQPSTDPNSYTWGSVGEHDVIIVSLAIYGNVMAAVTISELLGSFPNIKFGLLVGIGAGLPRNDYDVRLGDIVVGYPVGTSSGVIQYDLGKAKAGGTWERKDSFNRPPEVLLKAISALQASRDLYPSRNTELVQEAATRYSHWGNTYVNVDTLPDKLFKATYHHPIDARDCFGCDPEAEIKRSSRDSKEPIVHYGVIASGNSLVKDAETREKIAKLDPNCICLEMEAAGLVNSLPCLVIRGICDYADTHKNDSWQKLVSARAAAYAKELLDFTAPNHHDEQDTASARFRIVSSARRYGRVKQARGQGKTKEQLARLLPLLHRCPYAERKNRNIKRIAGTCEWFTSHKRFEGWYSQNTSSLLWVSADPGCGKSVLARYLVDEVFPAPDRIVCYFFFKDDTSEQRSASIAMCALLHQILERDRELLKHPAVKRLLTSRDNFEDAFWDLWGTLMTVVADQKSTGEIIFVLDALDECSDSDRNALIEAISEVDFEGPTRARFKILLTSRPYDHIQRGLQALESKMPVIHLSGEGPEEVARISEEIGLVIKYTVQQISLEKQLTPEEHDFLLEHLTSIENRTYLWVHLMTDLIRKNPGFNKGDVRRAITELPSSVDEAYERILSRCSDIDKARKIFSSILAAEGALTVKDISVILAFGDDEGTVMEDIEANIEPADRMATTIRDLCGLFVVVKNSEVHLLHQTAREFLISKDSGEELMHSAGTTMTKLSDIRTITWRHSFKLTECHRFLTSVCVRFLQMDQKRRTVHEFETYATSTWDRHMDDARLEKVDRLVTMALELCSDKMRLTWLEDNKKGTDHNLDDKDDSIAPTKKSGKKSTKNETKNERLVDPRSSPMLIFVAWIGVEPLMRAALDRYTDVNISDVEGTTALWWAAEENHVNVIKLLLARGAKLEGNTLYPDLKPLHKAAANESLDAVNLLLAHGANVNVRTAKGAQPLHYAAVSGNKEVVKILLEARAEVNGQDDYGSTPLHDAASWGHLEIIQLLLQHGAEINSTTKTRDTPLSDATQQQDIATVNALLEAGADINLAAEDGVSPLLIAAQHGSVVLARCLISRGAEINQGGRFGTPLCQAVYGGHLDMVTELISCGADVNWGNQTARPVCFWIEDRKIPSWKVRAIIKTLADHGANLDTTGWHGRTMILECCLKKRTKLVKMLCRFQASIDDVIGFPYQSEFGGSSFGPALYGSYRGWTILHAAAFMADTELVHYLLYRGASINAIDTKKHTPLFWALMGCVDNLIFHTVEDDSGYWQWPFFWTSMGLKGPPKMIMPREAALWREGRAKALKELYPKGYEVAQLATVKLLLENGANPHIKGVNWRYSLLPGLRKFREQRKALFTLLKEYQDKPLSELPERTPTRESIENDSTHKYEIAPLDNDSPRESIASLNIVHIPHTLSDIIEDESEHEGSEQVRRNRWRAAGLMGRVGREEDNDPAAAKARIKEEDD